MINQKLTDRAEITEVTDNALIHVVEPTDTSQGPAGSSYKAKVSNVFSQNNTGILRSSFWPYDEPPTEATVVDYINEYMTFSVTEIQAVNILRFTALLTGVYYKFTFLWTGGKGDWGAPVEGFPSIQPVSANRIRLVGWYPETVGDVVADDDTVIIPLDEVAEGEFLEVAGADEHDFSDTEKQYYFSYTTDDVLYLALFIGMPGIYGGGGTDFVEADFAQIANGSTQPFPNLEAVTGAGATTSFHITVLGDGAYLVHQPDGFLFVGANGKTVKFRFNDVADDVHFNLPDNKTGVHTVAMLSDVEAAATLQAVLDNDGLTTTAATFKGVPVYFQNASVSAYGLIHQTDDYLDINSNKPIRLNSTGLTPSIILPTTGGNAIPFKHGSYTNTLPSANGTIALESYVDNAVAGLFWKKECLIATTANITLSGLLTIDGVTLIANDRVLVKNQTTAADNGIYIAASGAWARADDADTGAELANKTIPVTRGTVNQDTWWTITNDTITLGSTAIILTQTGGMGTYANGTGLLLSGNIFSADPAYIGTAVAAAIAAKVANDMTPSTTVAPSKTAVNAALAALGETWTETAYAPTLTWTGTAPSGTITANWHASRLIKKITVWINFSASTPGASNGSVTIPLPAGLPAPSAVTGFTAVGDIIAPASGYLMTSPSSQPLAARATLQKSASGYDIVITQAAIAARAFVAMAEYQID